MAGGLQSAAMQLQSYGRGPDTMLAHISPDEAQFIDKIQGGRRTNPLTGLPEYSLFGNILKAIARAGAAVAGFYFGGPAGSAAAAAAVTKLTGGSWKDAAISGGLAGLGGGLGNLASGAEFMAAGNAAGSAAGATGDFTGDGLSAGVDSAAGSMTLTAPEVAGGAAGSGIAAIPGSTAAYAVPEITAAMNAAPTGLAGIGQAFSNAAGPIGGMPAVYSGLGALTGGGMSGGSSQPPPLVPPTQPGINLNVTGGDRGYTPYAGDYAHYGEVSHPTPTFFQRPNARPVLTPPAPAPVVDERNLETVFAARGGRIGIPHLGQHIPSPAAMIGNVQGPGTGTSDSVPAKLSDGEHVIDAGTVSAIGNGSNDAGHRAINKMKTAVRAKAGFKNPSRPPAMRAASRAGLMSLVPKV